MREHLLLKSTDNQVYIAPICQYHRITQQLKSYSTDAREALEERETLEEQ